MQVRAGFARLPCISLYNNILSNFFLDLRNNWLSLQQSLTFSKHSHSKEFVYRNAHAELSSRKDTAGWD